MIGEEEHSQAVNVSECHIVLAYVLFKLVDDLLDRTPFGNVGPLEGDKLLLCVNDFAFLNYELWLIYVTANWNVCQGVTSKCIVSMLYKSLLVLVQA